MRYCFPFTAIIGQERVKKALILNVINPRIGGALISGEKGTAKSTLVRGLACLMNKMEVIDLPLNITEDKLIGSLDIETAVIHGRKSFEPSLLNKANGHILYIDEVNLLSEHIVNCLIETAASGINIVEREGISCRHAAQYILIGTMNPEEGTLRPQFLDRFGLYCEVHGEPDQERRVEIIKRRLSYEGDPAAYIRQWQPETVCLADRIEQAKRRLPCIQASERDLARAVSIAREGHCAGHRAEIIILETARAIAANNLRDTISEEDIQEAAFFVLPHRIRELTQLATSENHSAEDNPCDPESSQENNPPDPGQNNTDPGGSDAGEVNSLPKDSPASSQSQEQDTAEPAPFFCDELLDVQFDKYRQFKGSGKRVRVRSASLKGRYVKYRFPRGKVKDLAFDATFRAAALLQNKRDKNGLAVSILPPDFREKVRERHTGCLILFVVDASGSMGAARRMGAVKGAIISMLGEAYRKRDSVGMVAFRNEQAAILLSVTRSVERAQKCLKDLPTGGRTPLAAGLERAYLVLKTAAIKEPDLLQYLVLVSDGKANVPLLGQNALDDALHIAAKIRDEGIESMVLDTESGIIRFELAKKIAEALNARYMKIDDVNSASIKNSVTGLVA
jgi:magnesium chelatase subunit D